MRKRRSSCLSKLKRKLVKCLASLFFLLLQLLFTGPPLVQRGESVSNGWMVSMGKELKSIHPFSYLFCTLNSFSRSKVDTRKERESEREKSSKSKGFCELFSSRSAKLYPEKCSSASETFCLH